MATRSILIHPDPRLRKAAEPVESFDEALQTLVDDMFDTMYGAPGIGLAAPQVGVSKRVLVMDCAVRDATEAAEAAAAEAALAAAQEAALDAGRAISLDGPAELGATAGLAGADGEPAAPNPMALINPEIVWRSDATRTYNEGCLSIPDQFDDVTRPTEVTVRFRGANGDAHEQHFTGLAATCVQHEIDHLDGKLFIDYLGPVRRAMITSKMKKLKRERAKDKARGGDRRS